MPIVHEDDDIKVVVEGGIVQVINKMPPRVMAFISKVGSTLFIKSPDATLIVTNDVETGDSGVLVQGKIQKNR